MTEKLKQILIEKEINQKWKETTIQDFVNDFVDVTSEKAKNYNPLSLLIPSFEANFSFQTQIKTIDLYKEKGYRLHKKNIKMSWNPVLRLNPIQNLVQDSLFMVVRGLAAAGMVKYDFEVFREKVLESDFTKIERPEEFIDHYISEFTGICDFVGIKHMGQFVTYADDQVGSIIIGYTPYKSENSYLRRRSIADMGDNSERDISFNPVYEFNSIPYIIWNDEKTKPIGIQYLTVSSFLKAHGKKYYDLSNVEIKTHLDWEMSNPNLAEKLKVIKANHLNHKALEDINAESPKFGKTTLKEFKKFFKGDASSYGTLHVVELSDMFCVFDLTQEEKWYVIDSKGYFQSPTAIFNKLNKAINFSDEMKINIPVWSDDRTEVVGLYRKPVYEIIMERQVPYYVLNSDQFKKDVLLPSDFSHLVKELELTISSTSSYMGRKANRALEILAISSMLKNYDSLQQLTKLISVDDPMTFSELPFILPQNYLKSDYIPKHLIGYPAHMLSYEKGQWVVNFSTIERRSFKREAGLINWIEDLEAEKREQSVGQFNPEKIKITSPFSSHSPVYFSDENMEFDMKQLADYLSQKAKPKIYAFKGQEFSKNDIKNKAPSLRSKINEKIASGKILNKMIEPPKAPIFEVVVNYRNIVETVKSLPINDMRDKGVCYVITGKALDSLGVFDVNIHSKVNKLLLKKPIFSVSQELKENSIFKLVVSDDARLFNPNYRFDNRNYKPLRQLVGEYSILESTRFYLSPENLKEDGKSLTNKKGKYIWSKVDLFYREKAGHEKVSGVIDSSISFREDQRITADILIIGK